MGAGAAAPESPVPVRFNVRQMHIDHPEQAPAQQRLMICVSADLSQRKLIQEGARLAHRLNMPWIVVHVDLPASGRRAALRELEELAQTLGAAFEYAPGDTVAATLVKYAREREASTLAIGRRRSRLPWRRSVAEAVSHAAPELTVVLVASGACTPSRMRSTDGVDLSQAGDAVYAADSRDAALLRANGFLIALLACLATTLAANELLRYFATSNVVMLFLFVVVLLALRFGRLIGAWSALLCVASFDFFFVEPRFSFAVSDTQYLFTFALILVVAVVTGLLGARLRHKARVATAGERRATTVARVARELSGAIAIEEILGVCRQTVAPLFEGRVALVLPDAAGQLTALPEPDVDTSVAQWSFDHRQPAGAGTGTLNGARTLYLPLRGPIAPRGVLALTRRDGTPPLDGDEWRLLDACCSLIALALERSHFIEIAQAAQLRVEGERLRNALLAAVSHDLKTPLTAIGGLAETLEHPGALSEHERCDISRAIRLQTEGLHRLVTNLLDLARMQSEGVRLNKEWHALDEIVGSALGRLGSALARHRVQTGLPVGLPFMEIDAIAFERVLVNLVDNAIKYTPPGSTISIRAQAHDEAMQLIVEDDGPGLPQRDSEPLFDAFTRGVKESSISGVGLGLALCRAIVVAHGGAIEARNRESRGTCFTIRLPLGNPPPILEEPFA